MHRLADDNEDNAPFQIDYLDLGYKPNSYSAYATYQSPLLAGDTPSPLATSSGTLPSIA